MSEITYPKPVKIDFQSSLKSRIERASKAVEKAFRQFLVIYRPQLEQNVRQDARLDAIPEKQLREKLKQYIEAAQSSFLRVRDESVDRQLAISAVNRVDEQNREELFQKFKEQLQISALPALIGAQKFEGWIEESVDRIKTLQDDFFDDVFDALADGIRRGDRPESIAEEIQSITGKSKKMSELLARDQFGDLNAKVNEERQTDLGIEKYRWTNSSDKRVRRLHTNAFGIGGDVFTWESGGHSREGHPGEPYNCRCTPDAILQDPRDLTRNDAFFENTDIQPERTFHHVGESEVEV